MSEKVMPFVVTDRRKFNLDGEPRPDADPSPEKVRPIVPEAAPESSARVLPEQPTPLVAESRDEEPAAAEQSALDDDSAMPPPPTPEQMQQSKLAFDATADRLDIAIRSANPGMEHAPKMSFGHLVQSIYMTAIIQLGGNTPEGQKPQVDLLGARQSIDTLTLIAEKTAGNLTTDESALIDSAVFELRMAFLELTQALARSAAARNPVPPPPGSGKPGTPRPGFGPSIVR